MKTNVQTFCQELSEQLSPFSDQLDTALDSLPENSELPQLKSTVMSLREVQQRLATLQQKVEGQQAFLLIFGPLKSGKSTLMNAISGAYVSEVSSLPAYPALVYVKHGEQRHFQATTYGGQKRDFEDSQAMSAAVEADHTRLASAILDVERANEDFDPRQHYPEAIRRMDVEIPAQSLAESGSVLVDTPGLYSRMKFGYDQMTRDFRDTAACAIFVVKTDNLFFEKVFEEFEELLDCFSRIFLISNIDTSKKDLKPDGSLEASLESRDPEKVIDAFRALSMSASLRAAIDEGRLNIYPIDLLRAASKILRQNSGLEPLKDDPNADPELIDDGFDRFLEDLTNYLNSSDYLHDFMFDSLRVAQDINEDTAKVTSNTAAQTLQQSVDQLHQNRERAQQRLDALDELQQQDWQSVFKNLYAEKERLFEALSSDYVLQLDEVLQAEISAWLEGSESWNQLTQQRLDSHLQRQAGKHLDNALEQLRKLLDNPQGGAQLSSGQTQTLNTAGLDLNQIVSGLVRQLGEGVQSHAPSLDINITDIPVKRTLSDYAMFRSGKQTRAQLFGKLGDQELSGAVKQRRLAGKGVNTLREKVSTFVREQLPELQASFINAALQRYVDAFSENLQQNIDSLKQTLQQEQQSTADKLEALEMAQQVIGDIDGASQTFAASIQNMQFRHELDDENREDDAEPEEIELEYELGPEQ